MTIITADCQVGDGSEAQWPKVDAEKQMLNMFVASTMETRLSML